MQQKDFVVIQKVCSLKTSKFRPTPPCSSLFILHAGWLWIFWNEKLRSEKREKKCFFCKLNIKEGNVFYTYIYKNNNKNIYMFIYKKNAYVVLRKLSATTKQLIRRSSICCLKKKIHKGSIGIGLTPPLPYPYLFSLALKGPSYPPPQQTLY